MYSLSSILMFKFSAFLEINSILSGINSNCFRSCPLNLPSLLSHEQLSISRIILWLTFFVSVTVCICKRWVMHGKQHPRWGIINSPVVQETPESRLTFDFSWADTLVIHTSASLPNNALLTWRNLVHVFCINIIYCGKKFMWTLRDKYILKIFTDTKLAICN